MSKAPPTKMVKIHPYITEQDKALLELLAEYFQSSISEIMRSSIRTFAVSIAVLDPSDKAKALRKTSAGLRR